MDYMRPLYPLKYNYNCPPVKIINNGELSAFCIHNSSVTITNISALPDSCGGNLCDKNRLMDSDNTVRRRCACIQMPDNRSGSVFTPIEVEVRSQDGSFTTMFYSKFFFEKYILSGGRFPSSVTVSSFDDSEFMDRYLDTVMDVTTYINNLCGWRSIGWVKPGEALDQSVDQPNNGLPYNAQRQTVQSANLKHHLVTLEPMAPHRVDIDRLNGLKFDFNIA